MASTTTNLGLKVVGNSASDKAISFEDWRLDLDGEGAGSNMQLIDAAFGALSDYIVPITNAEIDALFE